MGGGYENDLFKQNSFRERPNGFIWFGYKAMSVLFILLVIIVFVALFGFNYHRFSQSQWKK